MKIWNFPTVPVSKQLFHVPGQAQDGGYTSGAVHMLSPEPGGRGVLELQLSLQVREWEAPLASWLMSKGNGEVFRVALVKTPQLITAQSIRTPSFNAYPRDEDRWHAPNVPADLQTVFTIGALEGSTVVRIDMLQIGPVLKHGHVLGHGDHTYVVDDIAYDSQLQATVTVKPPLRKNVIAGDRCLFKPYFLGTISNIGEVRATYDAELRGAIQPGKIVFAEAIV